MKKYIVVLFLMLCATLGTQAQVQTYKSTAYAQANVYSGKYYWGDWERSSVTITINLTTDVIKIYSPRTQIYNVVANNGSYTDNKGGKQISFTVYDQDGDRGTIRLRIEANGNSQLYVDFSNVAWVYNVIRID